MTVWVGIAGAAVFTLLVGAVCFYFARCGPLERENVRLRLENADLLGRLGALTESMVRIKRSELGMSELPRVPRGQATITMPDAPPPAVSREIMGIGDERIRSFSARAVEAQVRREGGWEGVMRSYTTTPARETDGEQGQE